MEIVEAKIRIHVHRYDRSVDEEHDHKISLRRAEFGMLSGQNAKYR